MTRLPCTGGQGAAWAAASKGRQDRSHWWQCRTMAPPARVQSHSAETRQMEPCPGAVSASALGCHQARHLSQGNVQGQSRKLSQQGQAHHDHIQYSSCKDQAPSLGLKQGSWAGGWGWVSRSYGSSSFCLLLLMEKKGVQLWRTLAWASV